MIHLHNLPLLYLLSGLAIGVLTGMTGTGGGALMTPVLILIFGIHPVTAVGTDLLYACITKASGTVVHGWNRTVAWKVVAWLAVGSVPMTALTLLLLFYLDIHGNATQNLVTKILGVALFLTAISLIFRKQLVQLYSSRVGIISPRLTRNLTILTGAVLGVLVSISSVGAGAIGVTALILLYPEMPIAVVVGSGIAHAVPLTLIAGLGHWWLGSVNWQLLVSLLVGSIPGIILGSMLSSRIPEIVVRVTLSVTLIIICAKFWFF
ncbi:MAG TPA: sulfite exporter TauE/SafE family protein [Rhizomicrobium sp.]|nr:sulfite exporter TauE/SafE family protein [Rhizomicrobium sp.]